MDDVHRLDGSSNSFSQDLHQAVEHARRIQEEDAVRVRLHLRDDVFQLTSPLLLDESHDCLTVSGNGTVVEIGHARHPAIVLKNAQFVTLEGLHVRVASAFHSKRLAPPAVCHIWVGPGHLIVHLVGGSNNTLQDCQIEGGLYGEGGFGHAVTRSRISNSWGGCMGFFSAGDSRTLTPCGHTFTQIEVFNCTNADGIGLGDVTGALVANNDIHDVGCAGLRLNGVPDPYRYATGYPENGYQTPFQNFAGERDGEVGLNVSAGSSAINIFEYNHIWHWALGDVKYASDMGGYYMWCDLALSRKRVPI